MNKYETPIVNTIATPITINKERCFTQIWSAILKLVITLGVMNSRMSNINTRS